MQKIKILTVLMVLSICFSKCGNKDKEIEKLNEKEKVFTENEIAKYTISAVMNQPFEIMDVVENYGNYFVSYVRKDDKKIYRYKVKIEDNRIIWANSGANGGRWRNSKYDEIITYFEKGDSLIILQSFNDGSKIKKGFKKS